MGDMAVTSKITMLILMGYLGHRLDRFREHKADRSCVGVIFGWGCRHRVCDRCFSVDLGRAIGG